MQEYTTQMINHLAKLEQRRAEATYMADMFDKMTLSQKEARWTFIMDSIAKYPHIEYYDTVQSMREIVRPRGYGYKGNVASYVVRKMNHEHECLGEFTLEIPFWEISPDLVAFLFLWGMPNGTVPSLDFIPEGYKFTEESFYALDTAGSAMTSFPTDARDLLSHMQDGVLAYAQFMSDYSSYLYNTIMGLPDDFYKTTHYRQFLAWLEVRCSSYLDQIMMKQCESDTYYEVASSTGRVVISSDGTHLAHDHILDYYEFNFPREMLSND